MYLVLKKIKNQLLRFIIFEGTNLKNVEAEETKKSKNKIYIQLFLQSL